MVANENNIHYIIDDGLFINDNEIIAGESAKKAPTKIETVKKALFLQQAQKDEIRKAIEKYKPESILILGTSDGMVNKIAANIGLPPIEKIIYIDEIATPEEIQEARRSRVTEGKHVIPVPTFEIKKEKVEKKGFLEAVRILLSEKNMLFESLREKLESYPELNSMLYSLLFTGKANV